MRGRAFIASLIFAILLIASVFGGGYYAKTSNGKNGEKVVGVHDILIENETALQKYIKEGIVKGKGTEEDPYTIEGITIKFTPFTSPLPIIIIRNFTSSYFVIKDVTITPEKKNLTAMAGISLYNVNNVVIENVFVNQTIGGIIVGNCHNVKILNSKIQASPYTFWMGRRAGSMGIQINNCTGIEIENVKMFTSYGILIRGSSPENYRLKISNVQLNGLPVLYYSGGSVLIRQPGIKSPYYLGRSYLGTKNVAGEIIVANAKSLIMDDVLLAGDLIVAYVNEVKIWNVLSEGANYGLYVTSANDMEVYASKFWNDNFGIVLDNVTHAIIRDNSIHMVIYGIIGRWIDSGEIDFNYLHNCTIYGISLQSAKNVKIEYNVIVQIGGTGIVLGNETSNISVKWNDIWNVGLLPGGGWYGEDDGKNNTWDHNSYARVVSGVGGIPAVYYRGEPLKMRGSANSIDEHPVNGTICFPQVFFLIDNSIPNGQIWIGIALVAPTNVSVSGKSIMLNSREIPFGSKNAIYQWVTGPITVKYENSTLYIPMPPRKSVITRTVLIIIGAAGGIGLITLFATSRGTKKKKKRSFPEY